MPRLCQYQNLFGKPGQGVHSLRLANVALVDVALTVLASWALYKFRVIPPFTHFYQYLLSLIILGIVLHWVFCVPTTLNKMLFGK